MPTANRERTKIYIVIGLSVLFVAIGYFRFFHGKIVSPGGAAREAGVPVRIEVPVVALKSIPPVPKALEEVPEPPRTMLRNIFAPGKEPSAGTEPSLVPVQPPKPIPSLTLTGTIVGGKIPLAFINGRTLRLGEKIEGLQIITITREQVTLTGEGQKVLLNVLKGMENSQ
jgi:hypothetical protein